MATAKKKNQKVTSPAPKSNVEKQLAQSTTLLFVIALLVIVLGALYLFNGMF